MQSINHLIKVECLKILIVMMAMTSLLLFNGCNSDHKLKKILQSDCVWDVFYFPEDSISRYCFKFKQQGVCNYFRYVFTKRIKTDSVVLYNDDDNILPNTWKIENDSVAYIRGNKVKIIKYSKDSIFLEFGLNESGLLIKNCRVKSNSEYW